MIIVKLMGGLGNQMFQYAAGFALATKLNVPLRLDLSFLQDKYFKLNFTNREFELSCFKLKVNLIGEKDLERFTTKVQYLDRLGLNYLNSSLFKNKLPFPKVVSYHEMAYYKSFNEITSNSLIDGYWQSEKYFKEIEIKLLKEFQWSTILKQKNEAILTGIESSNSVSVHVRRGDYVSSLINKQVHGTCDLDYYRRSINYISSQIENPVFYFFSDEPEWVSRNLQLNNYQSIIVDHNTGVNSFEDMRLMSNCKHNIIANSSFSWWGAWLNNNHEKVVVAPQTWFADSMKNAQTVDLIPAKWIRI